MSNKKEYIEREAVLNEQMEICHWDGLNDSYDDFVAVKDILAIPAADVEEVRHGEWVDNGFINDKPAVRCTECDIVFCDQINNHRVMFNYCPYCGVKMDGKSESECQ